MPIFHKLTFAALLVLSLGMFTSISVLALSHILFLPAGVYFFIVYLKRRDIPIPLRMWGLLGVWVTTVLSVLFNWDFMPSPVEALLKTKYFLIGMLSYFALSYSKDYLTEGKIRLLLKILLVTTSLATISGIIGFFTGVNPITMAPVEYLKRASGMNGMVMTYAYGLNFFLLILVGLWLYRDEVKSYISKTWLLWAIAINTIGITLSFTRGAWLGIFAGLPFFFFKKNKKIFCAIILTALFLVGGVFYINTLVKTPFSRVNSDEQRISYIQAAYKAFEERPIFGYGYRNFEPNVPDIKKKYSISYPEYSGHAHNNFFEHLASTGVLGAFAFALFCLLWFIDCYKGKSLFSRLELPIVASFVATGLVQYTFGDGENLFLLMLLFAMPLTTAKSRDKLHRAQNK